MLRTRFDNSLNWIRSGGHVIPVKDMETSHIINTLNLLINKPQIITSMLITDLESGEFVKVSSFEPWSPSFSDTSKVLKESIFNITSMSLTDAIEYALNSALGKSMLDELENRGVNIFNTFNLVKDDSSKLSIKL